MSDNDIKTKGAEKLNVKALEAELMDENEEGLLKLSQKQKKKEGDKPEKLGKDGKPKKYVKIKVKKSVLEYEKELIELQIELLKFQNYVKEKGLKVLILTEGRDAAGKGGSIKRLTIPKPTRLPSSSP